MQELTIKNITLGSGLPKICVPIVAHNAEELEEQLPQFDLPDIDLIEWRIDYMDCATDTIALVDLAKKIQNTLPEKPLLITFRTKNEGGELAIKTADYLSLLIDLANAGVADFIDLELFISSNDEITSTIDAIHKTGTKVILSNHDFQKTPEQKEIIQRLTQMQTLGADIAKIAVMPNSSEDVLTLLTATNIMQTEYAKIPIVTMSMGKLGVVSRLSGSCFGSAMTFGSLTAASAPGQIPVQDLAKILKTLG